MSEKIIFSLKLSNTKTPQEVSICIEDKEAKKMEQISYDENHLFVLYETSISINELFVKYPSQVFYNYQIDGSLLYKHSQPLLFTKTPSVNNVFINDTEVPRNEDTQTILLFYIRQPISDDSANVLYLEADAPVFVGEDYQKRAILMQREENYWLGVGIISAYLNQPIVYKYLIKDQNNNELLREKGRMHTLFIRTPVPNKTISIYDIWNDSTPSLSFYPHVIVPHQVRSNSTTVAFEYTCPQKDIHDVSISGTNKEFSKIQHFFPEDCWRSIFQIPRNDVACQYSIGTLDNIYNEDSPGWNNVYQGNILNQETSSDYISSRILFEPLAFKRLISVFIPLVSIRESIRHPVGEFKTLVSLARWCNLVGIGCIHVHIERLHHGLLDPIHANDIGWPDDEEKGIIDCQKSCYKFKKINLDDSNDNQSNIDPLNTSFHSSHHGTLLMPTVRDSKVQRLYKDFCEWNQPETDKNDFESFLECNKYIADHCSSLFEKWVQFTLFKQYEEAFEQIIDTGVLLITDLTINTSALNKERTNNNSNCDTNNNDDNDNDIDDSFNESNNSINNDNDNTNESRINDNNNNNNNENNINDNNNNYNTNENIDEEIHELDEELDLMNEIKTASHYSHGLILVGLCPHSTPYSASTKKRANFRQPLTADFVRNLFGDIAQNVLDTFFKASDFSVKLLDNAFVPKFVHNFASNLNSSIRDEFEHNMQTLIKIDSQNRESAYVFTELQNKQINLLASIAPNCPSSLILDQMSCDILKPEIVAKMGITPYSSNPIRSGDGSNESQFLGPMFLSPEMASEFPLSMLPEAIFDCVDSRFKAKEQVVEVYFIDVLRALGYDAGVEPIQTIKGHCRFLLQFTLQDLFGDQETNEKIRTLLSPSNRN